MGDPLPNRLNLVLRLLMRHLNPHSRAVVARSTEKGLTYIPPTMIDDEPIVMISEKLLEAAHPKWKECIIGCFVERRMPFKLIEFTTKHLWGAHLLKFWRTMMGSTSSISQIMNSVGKF